MSKRRAGRIPLYLLAVALLAACGGEETPTAPPSSKAEHAPAPFTTMPLEQRAAFALDRLLGGPEPSSAVLGLPKLHPMNLEMAQQDLIDMPGPTLALLGEERLIARLTGPEVKDTNPWFGVLTVLLALPQKPTSLVIEWSRPALQRAKEIALLRRVVRTLSTLGDPAAGPVLLELLETAPSDRIVAPKAFEALMLLGSPWRERALASVLTHGGPHFWKGLPVQITRGATQRGPSLDHRSSMAWSVHAMEAAGPRPPAGMPREQKQPFTGLRIWTDPAIRRVTREGLDGRGYRVQTYRLLPVDIDFGVGWLTSDIAASSFVPTSALFFTGKGAAAEIRCELATLGHAPFVAARDAEDSPAFEQIDPNVYAAAHHCVTPVTAPERRLENLVKYEKLLEHAIANPQPGIDGSPLPTDLVRLLGGVPLGDEHRARVEQALHRTLFGLRPLGPWTTVLNAAHDALVGAPPLTPEQLAIMERLAFASDDESRGVALHLFRRARYADYVPLVERMLADPKPGEAGLLWRSLQFLYSTVSGVEPKQVLGFVSRAATWVERELEPEVGPARAASFAVGLLDFGDPGGRAFARFLRGPDRPAYLAALLSRKGVLPPSVVEALVQPIDGETAPAEVVRVMQTAWRLFPGSSVGHVKALLQRVDPKLKPAVEAALVRIRHRGPREARGF